MQTMKLEIGAQTLCTDGACGEILVVVYDPMTQVVTDLVVEPRHRQGLGRLVPTTMAQMRANEIELDCTRASFDRLPIAEEVELAERPPLGNEVFGPSPGSVGQSPDHFPTARSRFRLPSGRIAVRDQHVVATDGDLGRVGGFAVDVRDRSVTHVLVTRVRLFGRRKIDIPIDAVVEIGTAIKLNITTREVLDLPTIGDRSD